MPRLQRLIQIPGDRDRLTFFVCGENIQDVKAASSSAIPRVVSAFRDVEIHSPGRMAPYHPTRHTSSRNVTLSPRNAQVNTGHPALFGIARVNILVTSCRPMASTRSRTRRTARSCEHHAFLKRGALLHVEALPANSRDSQPTRCFDER